MKRIRQTFRFLLRRICFARQWWDEIWAHSNITDHRRKWEGRFLILSNLCRDWMSRKENYFRCSFLRYQAHSHRFAPNVLFPIIQFTSEFRWRSWKKSKTCSALFVDRPFSMPGTNPCVWLLHSLPVSLYAADVWAFTLILLSWYDIHGSFSHSKGKYRNQPSPRHERRTMVEVCTLRVWWLL